MIKEFGLMAVLLCATPAIAQQDNNASPSNGITACPPTGTWSGQLSNGRDVRVSVKGCELSYHRGKLGNDPAGDMIRGVTSYDGETWRIRMHPYPVTISLSRGAAENLSFRWENDGGEWYEAELTAQ